MCIKLCKSLRVKTKDGKTITLRRPKMSDVKQLLEFINSLVEENAQILVNKRMTLKAEKEWLKEELKSIRKNKLHCFVAVHKGEIVGVVELKKGKWRESHIAEYAISVKKGYRKVGLATVMSKAILNIGRKDKEIKLIYLRVFHTNKVALNLYKKLGFKKVARLKKRVKYKGRYIDEIVMDFKK